MTDNDTATDPAGNTYPTSWYDEADLDENGYLTDSNGRDYRPNQGSLEPIDGRCNAPLTNWRERYPERRYCGQIIPVGQDWTFCSTHRSRESMKSAREMLDTGLFTESFDHLYEALDPYKQIMAYGLWSSLMEDSEYSFETTTEAETFDFSDVDCPAPPEANEDGVVALTVEYPSSHGDRGLHLWCAALDTVKMVTVQSKIMSETNGGVMENTETTQAQLTSPTEDDPTQEFRTIEELSEHHLNLPYSRLTRDREKLLRYGGVSVDQAATSVGGDVDELVLEVSADPETDADDPAPNTTREPESKKIVEKVTDGSVSEYEGLE